MIYYFIKSRAICLLLFLIFISSPLEACRIIDRRAMHFLEKGTPEQVAVFNKLKKGTPLKDADIILFHNAKEDAFQSMLTELRSIIRKEPLENGFFSLGYSGACSDSTIAFSDLSEYQLSTRSAINNTKATYPYELRKSPVERGVYHPLVTWLSEDSSPNATFEYRINGSKIPDDIRLKIQEKGGLNWLRRTNSKQMKQALQTFLSADFLNEFTTTKSDLVPMLRTMKKNEEGELVYSTEISTKKSSSSGEIILTPHSYTEVHSVFVYKISNIRTLLLNHSYDSIFAIDLYLDNATIQSELESLIKKDIEVRLNETMIKYENSTGEEKRIYEEFLSLFIGQVPEAGERFDSIKKIYWRLSTRYRTSPPR